MIRRMRRRMAADAGFSLIETLLAIFVLGIVATSVAAFTINALGSTGTSRMESLATNVADEALDHVKAFPPDDLCDGHSSAALTTEAATLTSYGVNLSNTVVCPDSSSSGASLPTTGQTATLDGNTFTYYYYIGVCFKPATTSASTSCGTTDASGDVEMYRAIIAVTWQKHANEGCPTSAGCVYVANTLISEAIDPVFNSNIPASATPPTAPGITSSPSSPSTNASPTFTFTTSSTNVLQCLITNPSGVVVFFLNDCPTTWSPGTFSSGSGSYTVSVTATNPYGMQGPAGQYSYVLMPVAPTVTAASSGGTSTSAVFTVSGIVSGNTATCTLSRPGGTTSPVTPCANGNVTATLTAGVGTYTLSVTQTDGYGDTSAAGTASYQLVTAPTAPSKVTASTTSSKSNGVTTYTLKYTVTATVASGDSLICTLTDAAAGYTYQLPSCVANSQTTMTMPSGAPVGTYTMSAYVTDQYGDKSATTTSSSFTG